MFSSVDKELCSVCGGKELDEETELDSPVPLKTETKIAESLNV